MTELTCSSATSFLEAVGPDYETYWFNDGTGTKRVLFADCPCVKPWEKVEIKDGHQTPESSYCTRIKDARQNSPRSGTAVDALWTKDLTVQSSARLIRGDGTSHYNIYYTGTVSNQGSILNNDGSTSYTPKSVTPTYYGDFDGDHNITCGTCDPTDAQDVAFFNAAFPSCDSTSDSECPCGGSGEPSCDTFNPLVDWNCDDVVNCEDRAEFLHNYPGISGLDNLSCP